MYAHDTLTAWSAETCQLLEQTNVFKEAKTILLYSALPDETDTSYLLQRYATTKTILLPVVCGNDLLIRAYHNETELRTDNTFGIPEPQGEDLDINKLKIDLIVVPGMAFTRDGKRLGRGKGYYDRLLSNPSLHDVYRIGICFPFQLISEIPNEAHDITMHQIISALPIK